MNRPLRIVIATLSGMVFCVVFIALFLAFLFGVSWARQEVSFDVPTWAGWAFVGGSVIILTLGSVVVYSRLTPSSFFDDGLTRCGNCGYILKGISEPRCPECGRRF